MAQDYPECSGFGRRREADGSQTRRWSKGVRKDRRRLPAEPGAAVRPLHSARGIPFGRATGTRPPPVFCGWHEPPLTHRLTMRAVQSLEPARRKVRHAEAEGVGPSSRRGTGSGRWVDPPERLAGAPTHRQECAGAFAGGLDSRDGGTLGVTTQLCFLKTRRSLARRHRSPRLSRLEPSANHRAWQLTPSYGSCTRERACVPSGSDTGSCCSIF